MTNHLPHYAIRHDSIGIIFDSLCTRGGRLYADKASHRAMSSEGEGECDRDRGQKCRLNTFYSFKDFMSGFALGHLAAHKIEVELFGKAKCCSTDSSRLSGNNDISREGAEVTAPAKEINDRLRKTLCAPAEALGELNPQAIVAHQTDDVDNGLRKIAPNSSRNFEMANLHICAKRA